MQSTLEADLAALRKGTRWDAIPVLVASAVALTACCMLPRTLGPWSVALTWVPIGLLQYRLVISGHEAVHRTLVPHAALNEWIGAVGQALVGVNFAAYRLQHMDHHRCPDRASDPDGHIYGGIIDARRGWRRLLTWTLGTAVEVAVKLRQKGAAGIGTDRATVRPEVAAAMRRHGLLVIACQLLLVALCAASSGLWWAYAGLWIGPLLTVTVFLNRTRILVEHGLPLVAGLAGGPRIPTVDIVPPTWQRLVFAPFLFNHHCAHHLHMGVPWYNLPQLRELCRRHGVEGYGEVQGGYLAALSRCLRA